MFRIHNCFAHGLVVSALASVALLYVPAAEAAGETVVYSFCSQTTCTDGESPDGGLINVGGSLYGTTNKGGANDYGTVFEVNPRTGAETVIYSFCSTGCMDGSLPYAGLINVGGTLYGTTALGGIVGCNDDWGCGTVFEVNLTTGKEKVVYSFCRKTNCTDGAYPFAGLTNVGGTLYGTTENGGANGYGTVFEVNPTTSEEKVVYSFCSQTDCMDGSLSYAGLIDVGGTLYGTTSEGGAKNDGTVFKVNPTTGAETAVYSFCSQTNCTDGKIPYAGLINVGGSLYGTTIDGGANDYGTVFEVNPTTGAETVMYSFCRKTNCTDGSFPYAGLIEVGGAFYGTTSGGGIPGCNYGCGTVFEVNRTTGKEKVLYSFCRKTNCTDGGAPGVGLIKVGGAFYGTTAVGGAKNYGTVFKVKLP